MDSRDLFIVISKNTTSKRDCAIFVNGEDNTIVHPVLGTAPRSAAGFLQLGLVTPTQASISSRICSIAQLRPPPTKKSKAPKRQRTKTNPKAGLVTAKPASKMQKGPHE